MTTPAEKDAMALAAIDSAAHALKYAGAKHEGVQQVIDARAHLAARVAELEECLDLARRDLTEAGVVFARELTAANMRSVRAEAELAAVLAFLRDDATAISYQSLGQYRKAAIDAARGAG